MKENNKKGAGHIIISTLMVIACVFLTLLLIFNSVLIVKSFVHKDQVPDFAGIRPFIVLSGSMEPTIDAGDLIFSKETDPNSLQEGDVISFYDPDGNGTAVVTHRIIKIGTSPEGEKQFYTRGDNNDSDDWTPVNASNVLGIYQFRIGKLGDVCMFMQTTVGLIICVVVPLILFVGLDILRRNKADKKKKNEADELRAELEKLKQEKAEASVSEKKETSEPEVSDNKNES